ncbi:hypothetical protein BDV27DRAFT_129004 [Aspergillus caelatus]|uniref:Fungal N-terminal domain-containing protein n=1 Tax=Aspergillus caelatus TaxID=61420 RepID=A0A5N7A4J1_9EURO|nr:uncharacterized protein BDV27DRAFT_129004 [Aspergillus caelatus]KAE8364109.1 hypothetical protein BDV27DRAFT_129004 [Aspergillus caelatus]
MEPYDCVSAIAALIPLVDNMMEILKVYATQKARNGTRDILSLLYEISNLDEQLEDLKRLLQAPEGTTLVYSQSLFNDSMVFCTALENLRKIDPKSSQPLLSRWGLQALQWPLRPILCRDGGHY